MRIKKAGEIKVANKGSKSAKKKKKRKKKTITVDASVHNALTLMKEELRDKIGGRITFNMVVRNLLNNDIELKNVRAELKRIKKESDETQEFIKQLLTKAISTPTQVVAVPQPNNHGTHGMPPAPPPQSSYAPSQAGPAPPPPPAPKPDLDVPEIEIPETDAEVKNAFNEERKAIFDGHIRRPSEILAATKPEHASQKVKEY